MEYYPAPGRPPLHKQPPPPPAPGARVWEGFPCRPRAWTREGPLGPDCPRTWAARADVILGFLYTEPNDAIIIWKHNLGVEEEKLNSDKMSSHKCKVWR